MLDNERVAEHTTAQADDFSRSQVPNESTQTGVHLALIIVGGTIGMSIFLMAARIGASLGLYDAALAFVLGSLILGVLGAMTSYVGQKARYTTYKLAEFAFGTGGAKFVNFLVALSLVGWFGVISSVLGEGASLLLQNAYAVTIPSWIFILLASGLIIGVTIAGFKGVDKLALYLVPVMLLFIAYATWLSWGGVGSWTEPQVGQNDFTFSSAISAVVASYIVGVVIQPDFSRFAKNAAHAIWSIFIALGVSFPIIMFFSAVPSIATGEAELITIMMLLGIGIPAFLLLFLGAWSSNVLCLYSSSLSVSTLFLDLSLRQITFILGGIGTIFALLDAQRYFVDFLIFLGIIIPPIAAIYAIDALLVRRCHYTIDEGGEGVISGVDWRAAFAWLGASTVAYMTSQLWLTITGTAALDSILVAAILLIGLRWRRIKINFGL